MKKFKVLLAAAAVAVSSSAFAQDLSFGVKAGLNFSKFSEKAGGIKYTDGEKSKAGICIGAFADYNLNDMFALEAGLQYEQKGGKFVESDYDYYGDYYEEKTKTTINYFTIPVNFRVNLPIGDNNLYFLAGPTFGIGLSCKEKVEEKEDGESNSIEHNLIFGDTYNSDYKRMNVGLLFGAGFEMSNNIGVRLTYDLGLSNLEPKGDSNNSTKTNVLGIAVTYKF